MYASNFDITKKASALIGAVAISIAAALFAMVPAAWASPSSLEDGIDQAVASMCDLAVTQGDELMEAQADLVGDNLEAITEQNAADRVVAVGPATAVQTATTAGPDTINVDGISMSYIDYFGASTAPTSGAGLWMGSDSTTDGTWGYFIGHNPGDFWHVMDLVNGDAVTVTDSAGASRTYHVVDTFTIPDSTYFEDIESRVTGYGESVILQTCCGDHANYRVVVAA